MLESLIGDARANSSIEAPSSQASKLQVKQLKAHSTCSEGGNIVDSRLCFVARSMRNPRRSRTRVGSRV
ncbi:hypothetical protein BDV98DRAFT_576741 [Pterulicium gracile]|uniref:Uncharacterized protein n=1 Tax=Pterulicium gracile TaxID=1884261 RepID=A0A5C3Q6R5_9AGAR|nr:hypothetical protein BDV98DRAFT_576741 [Pterula gracilis]